MIDADQFGMGPYQGFYRFQSKFTQSQYHSLIGHRILHDSVEFSGVD